MLLICKYQFKLLSKGKKPCMMDRGGGGEDVERLQIIGLKSAAELAIYGLDYTFKMNNNPVTTAVERY